MKMRLLTYASLFDPSLNDKLKRVPLAELAMDAARTLAKRLSARIDLHTTEFSATMNGKREAVAPGVQSQYFTCNRRGRCLDGRKHFGRLE